MADEVVLLSSAGGKLDLPWAAEVGPLDSSVLRVHRPMAHWIATRNGTAVARCSAWAEDTPQLDGRAVGVIGHYAAIDAGAGSGVLERAEAALRNRGLRTVVGPMDGNTWRSYRFVSDRGDQSPFFLEPNQPDDWPRHFKIAGYSPLAEYTSALNEDLSHTDPRTPDALARFEAGGGRVRPIDLNNFEAELRSVHALSAEAFARNFLYTPISEHEFLAMYLPLRELIRPELVLLAERERELVGFMFGVPNVLELRRGEPLRTAIAKSMAVRPGRTGAGLGSVLMDLFHQSARQAGFSRVIHALMHQDNASARISGRYGRTIRRYTLYAKELTP